MKKIILICALLFFNFSKSAEFKRQSEREAFLPTYITSSYIDNQWIKSVLNQDVLGQEVIALSLLKKITIENSPLPFIDLTEMQISEKQLKLIKEFSDYLEGLESSTLRFEKISFIYERIFANINQMDKSRISMMENFIIEKFLPKPEFVKNAILESQA